MSGPLDGLVVLDLTRFLSGPYCTWLLAGLGAEVIKIDDPAAGDPTANAPPFASGEGVSLERETDEDLGLAYLKRNRGKRSATLNLKTPEGHALFMRLAADADVVVQNFRPGVAARLGITHDRLEAVNARLVSCAITGYGSSGPDHDQKSFDLMAQAASGLMAITGPADGTPSKVGSAFSDMVAGTYAALGIVAAVRERDGSGRGQAVEVSMLDCLFAMLMDEPFDCYAELGFELRQGNRIARFSPFNGFETRDGWVVIGVQSASDWRQLCEVMGRGELATDSRFADVAWRLANNPLVDREVAAWTVRFTTDEALARLREKDVACAPVRTPLEAMASPQLRTRGMVQPLKRPDGTETRASAAAVPIRFSRTPGASDLRAPAPAADTRDVLTRRLGLADADLDELRARGVV